jgi:hypothetical protein
MNTYRTANAFITFQKATDRMIKKAIVIALGVSVLAFTSAATVSAQSASNRTVITFSQPVEIPGRVLPAGTYTFKLADSMTDRHIVQIFNADASNILATLLAIPNYRLTPTDKTVISFNETPVGTPEAIRAWFYPGNTVGQEFVYPKARAAQLAKATKIAVPAVAVDVTDADAMKDAPIMAVTPDEQEVPVAAAIQTTPPAAAVVARSTVAAEGRRLPQTASLIPILAVLAFASICAALGLLIYSQRIKVVRARVR